MQVCAFSFEVADEGFDGGSANGRGKTLSPASTSWIELELRGVGTLPETRDAPDPAEAHTGSGAGWVCRVVPPADLAFRRRVRFLPLGRVLRGRGIRIPPAESMREMNMLTLDRESTPRALLTVREVASMLGCGRTLVYDLISARELPVVKVGRLTRVPVEAVDHFIRGHVRDPGSPAMSTRPSPPRSRYSRTRAASPADGAQPKLFDDIA